MATVAAPSGMVCPVGTKRPENKGAPLNATPVTTPPKREAECQRPGSGQPVDGQTPQVGVGRCRQVKSHLAILPVISVDAAWPGVVTKSEHPLPRSPKASLIVVAALLGHSLDAAH